MSETTFDVYYKRLNTNQKKAVDTIEGPVMVIAGPGTGKTTVLTLRIANILRTTDTPPNGVLAITYTDAGVKAMRTKLQEVIGGRAHDVHIHTFHGFASAMIAEYPDHFVHIRDMKIMTDIEQETSIRDIITDIHFSEIRPLAKPDAYISSIIRAIEESKRQARTPDMVRNYVATEIDRIRKDPEAISSRGATKGQLKAEAKEMITKCDRTLLFADVYEQYEVWKQKEKKLDFSDLIIILLSTLKNDELLLRLIQERFLYILVDEHQDTNDAQNLIIKLIAEFFDTPNIFIVGDEKQAVYRFQGASVENFLLLQTYWPGMVKISLDTNYRSHQSILDASFGMIENNYKEDEHRDLRIRLKSGKSSVRNKKAMVEIVTGENTTSIESHLISVLRDISAREPLASVAIITRRNRDLDRVIRLCESHDIAISSERSVDIFNHPAGSIFFDLVHYLIDPSRVDMLSKTIVAGMWNIGFDDMVNIIKYVKSGQLNQHILETQLPGLVHIRRTILNDSALGFLIHAAELSGYISLLRRDPSYVYIWRGIITLAESIIRDTGTHDPSELILQLLKYRLSSESRMVKITVGAPEESIQAMTAHGSKGLEFDYVLIPYATEEAWIGKNKGSSFVLPLKESNQSSSIDIRRLFYVALTRAREKVTILTSLEESDGKKITPLRFVSELQDDYVVRTTIPRMDTMVTMHKSDAQPLRQHRHHKQLVHFAKHVLLEKGLSVTALNHFLNCPNQFLYQSILKLPQAPSVSADKGTAMHEAIAKIWSHINEIRSVAHDKDVFIEIQKRIEDSLHEYFTTSFLSVFDKQAVKKQLLEDARAVALALESHFLSKKENDVIYTEHWVKTIFSGMYDGNKIEIPLHGKLDAILDQERTVSVFDYKTRQALSINAIKGETKNSDGGYFRQLVFYKILLNSDSTWRSKAILPTLIFVSPDEKGRCRDVTIPISDTDIEKVKNDIQILIDSVWSEKILTQTCSDANCEWCDLVQLSHA